MDDLLKEFVYEVSENLDLLDQEIIKFEQNPSNSESIATIFRVMHTIKGTAGFLGLTRLGSIAHAAENLLSSIRSGSIEVNPGIVTLLLEAIDFVKSIVQSISETGIEPSGEDEAFISLLNGAALQTLELPSTSHEPILINSEKEETKAKQEVESAKEPCSQEDQAQNEASKPNYKDVIVRNPEKVETAGAQFIRVNLETLEHLMQVVSELVLSRNQLMQLIRNHLESQAIFQSPIQQLSYITTELQEGIMKTRMQPIRNAWAQFPRLIRDLSKDLGKKIDIKMMGEETELDRQLLEMIKDPLTHMVRNACDHGIEKPQERLDAGKNEMGVVTLSAYHESGHVIIEVCDDGRGLDMKKIRQKAIEKGLATDTELSAMTSQQIMQFIFHPGFSTAEKVTSVSGRGVGMDVVRSNIEKIGGIIEFFSDYGKGSKFYIKIPLTLAIVSMLIIEAGGLKFAIPQRNVQELLSVSPTSGHTVEKINDAYVLRHRQTLLPLKHLSSILDMENTFSIDKLRDHYVIVCKVGNNEFGLIVDKVFETEEIVVKPLSTALHNITLYAGNTVLGDGSVIMILDPSGLAKTIGNLQPSETVSSQANQLTEMEAGKLVSFLLFCTGDKTPKAIPIELVSRLEDIHREEVEKAAGCEVFQYRGSLMRLIELSPRTTEQETLHLIVFSQADKFYGLIAEKIIDVVHVPFDMKLDPANRNCLGSMVINGKTTDLLNISYVLEEYADESDFHPPSLCAPESVRILLVEDSPFFGKTTQAMLKKNGFEVTLAENGFDAFELLNEAPDKFKLIISDIEMPVMNGTELASLCRAEEALKSIPMIAYTGFLNEDQRINLLGAGFNECLIKTESSRLVGVINQLLHQETMNQTLSLKKSATLEAGERIFITIRLNEQLIGIPVDYVRDVLRDCKLNAIPKAPKEIPGSINLRGRIVNAFDLRIKLDLPIACSLMPMFVVIEYGHEYFSLLVDEVLDVVSLPMHAVTSAPPNLCSRWKDIASGFYQLDTELLLLMDVAALFRSKEEIVIW